MSTIRYRIEHTELVQLEVDLTGAPARVQRNATSVLRKSARLVQRGMQEDVKGAQRSRPSSIKHMPKNVDHRIVGPLEAWIGLGPPDNQGSLAHLIAHSGGGGPFYDYTAAIRRLTPAIVKMFGEAGADAVLGGDH